MKSTVRPSAVYLERTRKGTIAEARMRRPPIVGVPCFTTCVAGPSARICWPRLRVRRSSMNLGPITTAATIAIRPAIRTGTMLERSSRSRLRCLRARPRERPSRGRRLPDGRTTARLVDGASGVCGPTRRARTCGTDSPTPITSTPRSAASSPISPWYAAGRLAELGHLPEDRDRRRPRRARRDARARHASSRGSRCTRR